MDARHANVSPLTLSFRLRYLCNREISISQNINRKNIALEIRYGKTLCEFAGGRIIHIIEAYIRINESNEQKFS